MIAPYQPTQSLFYVSLYLPERTPFMLHMQSRKGSTKNNMASTSHWKKIFESEISLVHNRVWPIATKFEIFYLMYVCIVYERPWISTLKVVTGRELSLETLNLEIVALSWLMLGQRGQSILLVRIKTFSLPDHRLKLRYGDIIKSTHTHTQQVFSRRKSAWSLCS